MNRTACSMSEDPMSAPILTSTFAYRYMNDTAVRAESQAHSVKITAVKTRRTPFSHILYPYAFIGQRASRQAQPRAALPALCPWKPFGVDGTRSVGKGVCLLASLNLVHKVQV